MGTTAIEGVELIVLFGDSGESVRKSVEEIGGILEELGFGFGIITIKAQDILKINEVKGIQYVEFPKVLFTADAESNRASCIQRLWSSYGLSGENVLIGFIDTGIDYTHPAFSDEMGATRIEYIYNLAEKKIYDREKIDEALKSLNPLEIVPETDKVGHGTHVVGIACAGGKINKSMYGVAYKSRIAMVKITRAGDVNYALSTQVMRGMKFLIDKSKELKLPLVINISLSTNNGAHNGTSLFEEYIQTISKLERAAIVIAAGNEGEAAHHIGGEIKPITNISFIIGDDEQSIIIQLYTPILVDLILEITDPTANSSEKIMLNEGYKKFNVGKNTVIIYNTGPKPFDFSGEITISIFPIENFITKGEWKIKLTNLSDYKGQFDMWLPISEGLSPKTKFLQSNVYNTLGIPATVEGAISVGSYNYQTNNISPFSGRGKITEKSFNKPDILAPGEDILSTAVGNGYDTKTGTSMAAPHVSGACALILEWGIVQKNDLLLYGDRLKYYLLKGANRSILNIDYPNASYGYGVLCAENTIELLKKNKTRGSAYSMEDYGELKALKEIELREAGDNYINPEFVNIVVEYQGDVRDILEKTPDVSGFIFDENYVIISVKKIRFPEVLNEINEIIYTDPGGLYTLSDLSPAETSHAIKFHNNSYLPLDGKGVLVGILDTGIDYLNTEFINEDDTTRIECIWDQEIEGNKKPKGFIYGTEYEREEINEAIAAKKQGKDPYSIVPSKDDVGHGTHMASLVGAKGKNPELIGAAPACEFAIVKVTQTSQFVLDYFGAYNKGNPCFDNTDVLLAIKYLFEKGKQKKKPMVILIPMGTNVGSHDGTTIIERYIDVISKSRGTVVVTTGGNQGDTDNHTTGFIAKTGDHSIIDLRVGKGQKTVYFDIWCKKPDKVAMSIISPSGEFVDKIPAKLNQVTNVKFIYEGTKISIKFYLPEEVTGDQKITIRATDMREGIWKFKLIGELIVDGRYDAWLNQTKILDADTKFLNASPYTTVSIPGTCDKVITVGFYNQKNNSTVGESGRGYTRDGRVKPDIVAGGIGALVVAPGGGTTEVSGASVAAAVTAGCCALLFQWGIVDRNDPNLYAIKMKTYLIRGTMKRSGDEYPNPQWGYGALDMQEVFNNIRSITKLSIPEQTEQIVVSRLNASDYNENSTPMQFEEFTINEIKGINSDYIENIYKEYFVNNIFIRKPI